MSATDHFVCSGLEISQWGTFPYTTCVELQGALTAEWKKKFTVGFEASSKFHAQHMKWSGILEGGCKDAGYEYQNYRVWEKKIMGVKFTDWNTFRLNNKETVQNTQMMI